MDALWNKRSLEHPANNIWTAKREAIDIKSFSSVLEMAITDLESQNTLHTEAAILSRLIYRMKSKFRNDKGLKNMEKVNRALLNYLEIQLGKEYENLRNYIELDGLLINLPTKQMLEYILIRTQGFAKLMSRVESVAKQAAELFRVRISIGHAWNISVIAYAVISRVWFLVRFLLKRCCLWYNGVRKYLDDFKIIGPPWLPQNYQLPEDLKTWLNLPWIDQVSDSVPLRDDGKKTIFGLIKGNDDETCGVNFNEEEMEEEQEEEEDEERSKPNVDDFYNAIIKTEGEISSPAKCGLAFFTDDVGMSIDREDYAAEGRRNSSKVEIKSEEKLIEEKEESEMVAENLDKPSKKRGVQKSKVSTIDDAASPIPLKKRKKNSDQTSRMIAKKSEDQELLAGTRIPTELKTGKVKKKVKSTTSHPRKDNNDKPSSENEIKTRNDLAIFLSKDSHPNLDKLQWNMLMNSIKKFIVKLDKCQESSCDKKKEVVLLKKINRQIIDWIQ